MCHLLISSYAPRSSPRRSLCALSILLKILYTSIIPLLVFLVYSLECPSRLVIPSTEQFPTFDYFCSLSLNLFIFYYNLFKMEKMNQICILYSRSRFSFLFLFCFFFFFFFSCLVFYFFSKSIFRHFSGVVFVSFSHILH